MAQPLTVSYQGAGATLYTIVRRISDTYAWNGTAFEAWVNANVGTYDVALTDGGGDLYSVAFPTAIAAGDYRVFYYEQAGATPAITDLILKSEAWHWDGAELSTASSVSLSAYALTDLASLKRHIHVTTTADDTLLTELINATSAEIERVCGTRFKARDYREWYTGKGQRRLVLKNRPVQHVTRLAYGAAGGLTVRFSGSAIRANASVYRDPESADAGGLRLASVSSTGVKTASNLSFADYPSVSTLVTAANLISGWTATQVNNWPTADLFPTASEDALNRAVTFDYPDLDDNTYRVDQEGGYVEFSVFGSGVWPSNEMGAWGQQRQFGYGFKSFLCEYRAGYETIPTDVALVCRDLVKEAWYSGEQNTGVKSFSMGPYSVTFNDDQADRVAKRLAKYCDAGGFIGGLL